MEIRLARHCRHFAVVTIDNQRRLNAMRGRCCANSGVSGTSWSATSVAASFDRRRRAGSDFAEGIAAFREKRTPRYE